MKQYGDIDSKFRYIILASKRAKQLLKGSKPKIKSKSRNLIQVAQQEVKQGLVEYEFIQLPVEEFTDTGDDMFIGEEIRAAAMTVEEEIKTTEDSAGEAGEEVDETETETQPAAAITKAAITKAVITKAVKSKAAKDKAGEKKGTKKTAPKKPAKKK